MKKRKTNGKTEENLIYKGLILVIAFFVLSLLSPEKIQLLEHLLLILFKTRLIV